MLALSLSHPQNILSASLIARHVPCKLKRNLSRCALHQSDITTQMNLNSITLPGALGDYQG